MTEETVVSDSGSTTTVVQLVDDTVTVLEISASGPQGPPGPPGAPGAAATVAAGTTTTGAPGSNASVVNSGTSAAAVFDFTIPRGDDGLPGPPGPPGQDGVGAQQFGQVGTQTATNITVGTQGVYQSTGVTAVLDAGAVGIAAGLVDGFAVRSTATGTHEVQITATYDAFVTGPATTLGLMLAKNGTLIPETECRATTSASGALAKLHTTWIIDLANGDEVAMRVANFSNSNAIGFQRGRVVANGVTGGFGPQGPPGPAGQGVPVGGTTGQVLAKSSATDYDTGWVNQSGGGPALYGVAGAVQAEKTFGLSGLPGVSIIWGQTTTTLTQNFQYVHPFVVDNSLTVDAYLARPNAGSASATLTAYIYKFNGTSLRNNETASLVSGTTASISVTAGGDVTTTLTSPVTLTAGLYGLVLHCTGANSPQMWAGNVTVNWFAAANPQLGTNLGLRRSGLIVANSSLAPANPLTWTDANVPSTAVPVVLRWT